MLANPDRIEAQLFGVAHFFEEVFVVLPFGTILGVMIEER
jgi:H+/gluconate symporter-like permease